MHNLMRDRYWKMFYDTRYKLYYYTFYKQRCDIWSRRLKIFLSVVSCSGIAAWSVWESIPWVWAFIIGLSQIFSVIQEYLPFAEQSAGIEYLLPDLELIAIDMATDWHKIDDTDVTEIIDKISFYEKRILEIENRFLSSFAFLYNKKAIKCADDECKKFFEAYILSSNEEGAEIEQNRPCTAESTSSNR